jgi:hypothetical protein
MAHLAFNVNVKVSTLGVSWLNEIGEQASAIPMARTLTLLISEFLLYKLSISEIHSPAFRLFGGVSCAKLPTPGELLSGGSVCNRARQRRKFRFSKEIVTCLLWAVLRNKPNF